MNSSRPTITVIPASLNINTGVSLTSTKKRRVAAYARVSTDDEEQESSYEAQVDYYTKHIKSNPEWEFAGIYADEGISGTNTKRRNDFKRMVDDALNGMVDFIITKSVSRFARNTVDSLVTVRKLKEKGVEIYFEKENIYTLDSKGELLITIMSSIAQEESRSISENVTWGQRKRMQDGKVSMAYKRFLGYTKGSDGTPQIVEAEAEVIRRIYAMFLDGYTYREIAARLTEQNIPTPSGKKVWSVSTTQSILKNEKYAGNAILQKKFTVDFLTKKTKVNEGEVPQYFVENSHPAIISPETFEVAQGEIERRQAMGKKLSGSGLFVCKIICGDCGGFYGNKVWDSNNKYRREVMQCNRKFKNEKTCETPHLTEDDIKSVFVSAFNILMADKARLITEYEAKVSELADATPFDEQTARLQMECSEASALAQDLVNQNARTTQSQERYKKEYDSLVERYNAAKAKLDAARREKRERGILKEKIRRFLNILKQTHKPITAFDETLWQAAVESVIVRSLEDITVVFRSGTEIKVGLNRE